MEIRTTTQIEHLESEIKWVQVDDLLKSLIDIQTAEDLEEERVSTSYNMITKLIEQLQ